MALASAASKARHRLDSKYLRSKLFTFELTRPPRSRGAGGEHMRILCIGGGPAGLYFALLHEARRRRATSSASSSATARTTRSAGAWCSPTRRSATWRRPIPPAPREIVGAFNHWDDIDVHFKGRTITSGGHGFCGIGRKRLLNILQRALRGARRRARVRDRRRRRRGARARFRRRPRHRQRRPQQPHPQQATRRPSSRTSTCADCRFVWLGTQQAVRGVHVRVRGDASGAGSRRMRTSTTATRRRSSSRRPRTCGSAPASTRCRSRKASRSASGCSRATSTAIR